jgi:type II secretion system protein D
MNRHRTHRTELIASMSACAGLAVGVWAVQPVAAVQPAAAPSQPATPAAPPAQLAAEPPVAPGLIRFNFKEAPIDQVLDAFTRESGVPIIFEAAVPQGTISFISPGGYSMADAMSILNLNLARFGVHLRRQDQYLYLATIQDAMKKPLPVTDAKGVDAMTPDQIVTVSLPLDNARAELVAEQIKPMLGSYGGVLAVPAQNMVVVVESAAQVRRIRDIVQAIDAVRPVDSDFRIFPLRNAQADAVLAALRGLVGERVTTVIVDADGKKRTLQEQQVAGIQLAADPRTNSIIAVGTSSRIKTVEELISLLDTPDSGGIDRQMQTFVVAGVTPEAATQQLKALFAGEDPKQMPTIIPLTEVGKVTVVGAMPQLAKATALLAQLDPGVTTSQGGGKSTGGSKLERRAAFVPLKYATAASVEAIASKLLPPKMNQVVKVVAGPDGKSVIIAGPDGEVENLERTIAALDVQNASEQEIRIVQVVDADPALVLAQAQELYAKAGKAEKAPVAATVDAAARTITLIAPRLTLKDFETVLAGVRAASAGAVETRTFTLAVSRPTVLAARLTRLLGVMMPASGTPEIPDVPVQVDAVDELGLLVVRARAQQLGAIAQLVEKLDGRDGTPRELRVVPVTEGKAAALKDRAMPLYQQQVEKAGPVESLTVTVDEQTNSLLVVAARAEIDRFSRILEELQKQSGLAREVRLFEIKMAKAQDIVTFLTDMASSSRTLTAKGGVEPAFEVIEATNSLMVAARPDQMPIIDSLIRSLDGRQAADRPPVRILKLRSTDAANLAAILQKEFDKRSPDQRSRDPVSIEADPGTNTLIISASEAALTEIESVVAKLNETEAAGADGREIRIFPLKVARAEDLAQTIDQMFPEPPMPLDPRTRAPRPDLKLPREVVVRADRATNSLIVDAPVQRLAGFEQIVRSLDQAKVAADVVFRTYRIERAEINNLARTIRDLASSGTLASIGKVSTAPISVSVDAPTRMLVVSGHADAFPAIEELIKKVDSLPETSPTDLKLYPLAKARADRLSPIVQRLLASRVRESRLAAGKAGPDDDRLVEVTADAASNTLIVSAPAEAMAVADGLIKALDADSVATATEVRVFRLGKGAAETAAQTLRQTLKAQSSPGEPEAVVTPEPASNTITVVGTSTQLERAAKLIESLDVAVDIEGLGVRTVPLKHARAESLAPVMEQVLKTESGLDRLPQWARQQAIARGAVEQPRIRVAAEPRINALIVSGPRSVLDMAEEVAAQLDVEGDEARSDAQRRLVRVITLQNADAAQLATNIAAVFAEERSAEPAPLVRVDPQANAIIVRGTQRQMELIEQLTTSLDKAAAASSRQMRTIAVDKSRVDAEMLARMLERLMRQQGGGKVEVISAEELLKRHGGESAEQPATPADQQGDKPAEPKKTGALHVIPLHHLACGPIRGSSVLFSPAEPRQDVPAWMAFIAAAAVGVVPASASQAQPDAQPPAAAAAGEDDDQPLTIAVDKATNSIVVVGSPRQTDRVAKLADQLSTQLPAQPGQVRVVKMPPAADVAAMSQVINQTIAQLSSTAQGRRSAFSGPVTVTPDPAGSALIVFANDIDFETVGGVIAGVSRLDNPVRTTIKVYPLVNINAFRALQAVRDLFNPTGSGAQARRVRSMDVSIMPRGEGAAAKPAPESVRIDPTTVRVTADPTGTSLLVAAPVEAFPLIDALLETLDQNPARDRLAIRRYPLTHAKADQLANTFQQLFDRQRQGPGAADAPQTAFIADARTNALLVTGSSGQHQEVERLLAAADATAESPDAAMEILTLKQASATTVQRIVEQVVVGNDPGRRERVRIFAQDGSNMLVVRAPKEVLEQVKDLVARIDTAETGGLPVHSIKLERADADAVAAALQRFFQERAQVSSRPGRPSPNRVAVVGDKRTGTVIVCAAEADFEQVKTLVATFDSPSPAADMVFRIVPLRNASVTEIGDTVRNMVEEIRWTAMTSGNAAEGADRQVFIQLNDASNSVVLMGKAEQIATIEKLLAALDVAPEQRAAMAVRSVAVANADMIAVKSVLEKAFSTPNWRPWRGPDPAAVTVQVDRLRKSLILVGKVEQLDKAQAYIKELDTSPEGKERRVEAIALNHARAERAANNLRQFFADRARGQGLESSGVSIIGSPDGNAIVVSAEETDLAMVRELVGQLDQPDAGKDRRIELYVLRNGVARETAEVLRSMFTKADSPSERVVITPQIATNSLVISAPEKIFEEVAGLLKQLDAPPTADAANIETIALSTARAQDVATALKSALPANVKVVVTPVTRSNSLLLTGSKEAIALVVEQVKKIDTEPVRSGQVFRRYKLANADAMNVADTLEQVVRARPRNPTDAETSIDYARAENTLTVYAPADQVEEIERIIQELDKPSEVERTTEFVKLDFANAEQTASALKLFYGRTASEVTDPAARNVTILADPLSNSLVIRADASQWEGIRALLAKLDTKEYDTRRQLAVVALAHADAASIARALNEGFRAPLEEQRRLAQARAQTQRPQGQGRQGFQNEPSSLVDPEGLPTVSAETQTNSLIIFAGAAELERIQQVIKQLDVSGFADMPAARIIALKSGKPSQVASMIRELYLNKNDRSSQAIGPRSVLVIGDDTSGSLIVRADDEKYAQILALARTLEEQGQIGRVQPHVVKLRTVAAGRLRQTLLSTFTPTARAQGETLAVEIDRSSNSLVIACSDRLLQEIRKVIDELDAPPAAQGQEGANGLPPSLSQSVFIIDVANNDPAAVKAMLESMGVTQPQDPTAPGVVAEPVTIVTMTSRRAIAVIASAGDGRTIESLVKAMDAAPAEADQIVAIVPLKLASARTLAATLTAMLQPSEGVVGAAPGKALAEHVRRLGISRTGVDQSDRKVDLSRAIRVLADDESNALVIASTQANVDALRDLIRLMDTLPAGDAVMVRIFPLGNASAARVKQVIEQLFAQGESLRRLPGTQRQGLPPTAVGQALAGEIAAAVDERTNTLIVAGREEGVALVEVLIKDLDSDRAANWIEPLIIPLTFADASTLARTLDEVLVKGASLTPEAMGLQKQFGRLRVSVDGRPVDPEDRQSVIQADLFAPVTGLVITSDAVMNSLIVVGTPANNKVVQAMVAQLDVEAASAANAVRVFPLVHASSDRVAGMIRDLFRQRESLPDMRPQDKLIITSDVRTNALIVATSPKSVAIVEGLIKTLDGEKSNYSVGLHVVPVPGSDVRQLAPRIDRLMKERISAASRGVEIKSPLDAFSIEPEPVSNLLIVACSQENLVVVKELVAALTEDAAKVAAGQRTDLVQLTRARAAEASQSLAALYVDRENQKRGREAVTVTPNERLNALVIAGTEQDIIELRALATRIDSAEVAARQQIKAIELRSANAREVVRLVEAVIAGRPVGGGRGVAARQATRLQFLREALTGQVVAESGRKPTEAEIDGAIKDLVMLTADPRTNSIWITAPESMVALLSEMIEDIEKSNAGARKIEKFTLINADARQMAQLLKETFRLEQQGGALVLLPTGEQPEGDPAAPAADAPAGAGPLPTVTAVPDERQQLSIAVDARTNTLIVSGTDEYLSLVRKVITELDSIQANERERRVYSLRNAKAREIETTLRSYFKGENDSERATLGPQLSGSLMRRLEQEVTVVGDEKSNKLVISTSPRYMDTVLSIVNELDTPPPQVMIQVLLAEVTLDTTEQWGMDISVGPFGGEGYKVGSLAGGSGVATALGVPNLSVSSADFGILVRSLEAQGKLEILSNPQVTVNNNQKAEINVGDDIGVAGNTERSSLGTLISSVSRIPVGILMNVTPAISEDGFVRMEITPEISQLTNRTTQINRDQTSPVIAKRRVDTVVTVRDGQSVVIGGLIQTTQEERRSKVPILGDIPVLGLPFRTKLQEAKKTELLVIVTPRVIPSVPGQAHGMAEDVSEQSVNRMEDSGRVLDYLESIKADIKAARDRAMRRQQDEAEGAAAPETEAEQSPEPATVIPSPQPAQPTYVQPRR